MAPVLISDFLKSSSQCKGFTGDATKSVQVQIIGEVKKANSIINNGVTCAVDADCLDAGYTCGSTSKVCETKINQDKFEWSIDIQNWPVDACAKTDKLDLVVDVRSRGGNERKEYAAGTLTEEVDNSDGGDDDRKPLKRGGQHMRNYLTNIGLIDTPLTATVVAGGQSYNVGTDMLQDTVFKGRNALQHYMFPLYVQTSVDPAPVVMTPVSRITYDPLVSFGADASYSLPAGAVAGIAIGCVAFIAVVAVVSFFRSKRTKAPQAPGAQMTHL